MKIKITFSILLLSINNITLASTQNESPFNLAFDQIISSLNGICQTNPEMANSLKETQMMQLKAGKTIDPFFILYEDQIKRLESWKCDSTNKDNKIKYYCYDYSSLAEYQKLHSYNGEYEVCYYQEKGSKDTRIVYKDVDQVISNELIKYNVELNKNNFVDDYHEAEVKSEGVTSNYSEKEQLRNSINNANEQLENGNNIILQYDDSSTTTFEKNNMQKKYTNKYYSFDGKIYDVKSKNEIELKISSGNYANINFSENLPSSYLKKGKYIKIKGRLFRFGTGIIFNHKIEEASLLSE